MQPLGISRNQLARDIDVPVGRISDITNGKRGVTADTALRLARYFGIPAQLWLQLQAEYDLHVVRRTTWHEIEPRVRILDGAKRNVVAMSRPATGLAGSGNGRDEAVVSSDAGTAESDRSAEIAPDGLTIPPIPADEH